jgi:hypothetical protein
MSVLLAHQSNVMGSTGKQLKIRKCSAALSQMGLVAVSSALLVLRALFFVSVGWFCWLLFLTGYSAPLQFMHGMHHMGVTQGNF